MLEWVAPQLAQLVSSVPTGDEWLHETKFDGYRIISYREGKQVRLMSRNHLDWTEKFPALVKPLLSLPAKKFIIDGEVCVVNDEGLSSFKLLQQSFSQKDAAHTYFVFDIMHLDGDDLTEQPLVDRKAILELLIEEAELPIAFSNHIVGRGAEVHKSACRSKWEGIISKRATDSYRSGRSSSWQKSKCLQRDEFLIIGFSPISNGAKQIGALLLGRLQRRTKLVHYCGKVGTGFDNKERQELWEALMLIAANRPPLQNPNDAPRQAHWVTPKLVAQIAYAEWTASGLLRQPVYLGLRLDKAPREVNQWS